LFRLGDAPAAGIHDDANSLGWDAIFADDDSGVIQRLLTSRNG
jgi:hypothetical protein